ncbi:MAG: glutathione S-transferase family protein [Alphaproteobacteria bacterium]|nr:glutathione S-transferase family protein [Alphaproteobacteria bacterium]
MLRIWGRANSSNVQKVLWACEELGIAFERIDAGGAFGKTNEAAYLEKNPNGLVPTVEDGETILWESNTILRYLATTRNAEKLYPKEPVRRAMAERWMDWQLASLNPPMTVLLFGHYRTPPEKRDATALEEARRKAIGVWTILEGCLGENGFAAGTEFTLADLCLGIFVHRWHSYPIERPALPRLKRYYDRLAERAGYRKHVMGPIT